MIVLIRVINMIVIVLFNNNKNNKMYLSYNKNKLNLIKKSTIKYNFNKIFKNKNILINK
jgi:hypothetical protein